MSDLDELLAAFSDGTLIRPDACRANLVSLARAVTRIGGAPAAEDDPAAADLAARIGAADHLVLVVADGCGMTFLDRLPAGAFLRRHLVGTLASVFPSSTGPAMFSLFSAAWPGRHGFLGWFLHLPALGDAVTPYRWVRTRDGVRLDALGIDPGQVFLAERAFDGCRRDTALIMPADLTGSPASDRSFDPARTVGISSLEEAVDAAVARVRAAAGPTLTLIYWHSVDHAAHDRGASHPETRAEVLRVDAEAARLSAELAGRARVVLTADHGQLDYEEDAKVEVDPGGDLGRTLRTRPAGEARVVYLHARGGEERRLEDLFRERAGERFFLLAAEEVEELRLLAPGPLDDEIRARVGTHVAIARGRGGLEWCRPGERFVLDFVSMHGGLTPEEMRIPLVLA